MPSVTTGRSAAISTATTPGTASAARVDRRSGHGRAWRAPGGRGAGRAPRCRRRSGRRPVTFGPRRCAGSSGRSRSSGRPPGSRSSCGPLPSAAWARTAWAGRARAPILTPGRLVSCRRRPVSGVSRRPRAGHQRPDHGRRDAVARSRLRRARDRHRPDRRRRGPAGQQDRFVRGGRSRSWPAATSSAPTRSTPSGWRGRSSASSTAGRASTASRRWPRSTSRPGTSSASTSASRSGSSSAAGSATACRPTRTAGTRRTSSRPGSPSSRSAVVARGYRAMKLDPFGAASVRSDAPRPPPRDRRRRRRPRGDRPGHRPDDRDARPLLARHGRPDRGRARAVRAALDRGAGPARERGRPRARPARDDHLDRDRRADPRDLGRGAVHRGRQRRHHPGRSDPFRRVHRDAPPGRLDRGALPDPRAAQRRRPGRDRGQRPFRGRRPATSTSSSTSTTSPTRG